MDSTGNATEPRDSLSRLVDSLSLNNSPRSNDSPSPSTSTSTRAFYSAQDSSTRSASLPPPVPLVGVSSTPTLPASTFVLFQPDCVKHRYIRDHHDISEIVERPQRIRAVKAGVAAAWSKYEHPHGEKWSPPIDTKLKEEEDDDLGNLMQSLSIGAGKRDKAGKGKMKEVKGKSSRFDILVSDDQLSVDSLALQLVHGVPNYPADHSPPTSPTVPSNPALPSATAPSSSDPAALSSPSRRLSPRKIVPSSDRVPYPSESPWPVQLLHLVDQVPPLTSSPTSTATKRESEIPPHLPQGDLYLCPESKEAIFGALGAVCKGVDLVMDDRDKGWPSLANEKHGYENGFVVIRPPGHHCGEANPQGFCFVNNVAVAAAHAHLEHGINRVIILDIDLHHGNGTQEIVWQINEKANRVLTAHQERLEQFEQRRRQQASTSAQRRRSTSPTKSKKEDLNVPPVAPRPLQIMYSSLHDVLSYPCESGDPSLIAAASLSISGPHSQFIHNAHLERYDSEQDFKDRLWPRYWQGLGGDKVQDFLDKTSPPEIAEGGRGDDTLILVSAGFDASIHEYSSMSRHGRNVPTCFYTLFADSIRRFAHEHARGRLLFVLEGGYSDKALVNGSMGVLRGLMGDKEEEERLEDLERIVKVCGLGTERGTTTKRRGGGATKEASLKDDDENWIKRTKEIFDYIDDRPEPATHTPKASSSTLNSKSRNSSPKVATEGGGGSRQLRERKVRLDYAGLADMSVPLSAQLPPEPPTLPPPRFDSTETNGRSSVPLDASTLPQLPPSSTATSQTAFSSVPTASFYPTNSQRTGEEGDAVSEEVKTKPAIKFVWKQGGIGGSAMGGPRM